MKRTAEIILTVIGLIIYAFVTFSGTLIIWIQNNQDEVRESMDNEVLQEQGISINEFNQALEEIGGGGWMLAIIGGLAVIVGIIAIVFLKGNKKPQPAGIILIVIAAVSLLFLGFGTWLIALPYVIAGIMAIARKSRPGIEG